MSDLIKSLDQETAVVVTDLPLLDRAIDAVISTMSKAMQGANSLMASSNS
jgi:hypothetical protein